MRRRLREVEENYDDKLRFINDKLNSLNLKSKEIQHQIQNSNAQASTAQSSIAVGVNPESKAQDKKMKQALAAKSRSDMKYYQDELQKIKAEINLVNQEKINLLNQKKTQEVQKEQKMVRITKNQILRMVEFNEPARMKKRELIESISNLILKEDMNDDIRRKIESGENDYSKHLDADTVKRMADSIMNDVRANLQSKMGINNVNIDQAKTALTQGLIGSLHKEMRHKRKLEQLAVQLVRQEYDIPEDAVDFEVHITGHPEMGGEPIRKEVLKMRKGNKRPPQGKTEQELKPNVTKRRLMNAMMHGAARKGQNLFYMAQDQLNRIDPTLVQDYSKLMAGNDFMYWALDDQTIAEESESGVHAGQVRVDISGPKPKIIAHGMTFPFLLHELTKGVLELISLHGLDVDKEIRNYVLDKTDNLESEPWDIRLGPKIWEKFLETLDVDDLPIKSHIFNRLVTLPPAEFNSIIHGLLNNLDQAKNAVRDLADEVRRELNQEEVDTALGQFSDEGGSEEGEIPEEEDEEDPLLKSLLDDKDEPQDDEEKESYDDPETWSKKQLEQEIDAALDRGDFDSVRMLSDILNRKY